MQLNTSSVALKRVYSVSSRKSVPWCAAPTSASASGESQFVCYGMCQMAYSLVRSDSSHLLLAEAEWCVDLFHHDDLTGVMGPIMSTPSVGSIVLQCSPTKNSLLIVRVVEMFDAERARAAFKCVLSPL